MSQHTFFASAPKHLGSLLADELTQLGLRDAVETRGGARFVGRIEDAYRACLWSRVANRILLPLAQFQASGPDALYAGAKRIAWEDHLAPDGTFAVRFDGELPGVSHGQFAALRVKDAIADRFTGKFGRRPNVDAQAPDLQVHVYAHQEQVSVGIDLSGESLHRRGYRVEGTSAPLKENLAAAILMRAGWPQVAAEGGALLDPMCGSGSLIIEGALIAADIAPAMLRERFGFSGWLQHDEAVWRGLRVEAEERREVGLRRLGSLRGYDSNPRVIRVAIDDLARAGLAGRAHFEKCALADCRPGKEGDRGLLVVNPPYGERLGDAAELPALYAQLGEVLKQRFGGWRAAVFTGNPELGKRMGLRAHRRHRLYNGPIECCLLHFEVRERPPEPEPFSVWKKRV